MVDNKSHDFSSGEGVATAITMWLYPHHLTFSTEAPKISLSNAMILVFFPAPDGP